jgi:hypothetical protein
MSTGSFPEVKSGRGVTLNPHPLLVPWSRKGRAIPPLPLWAVRPVQSLSACTRVTFTFLWLITRLWRSRLWPGVGSSVITSNSGVLRPSAAGLEAAGSIETTHCHNPEVYDLNFHPCENIILYKDCCVLYCYTVLFGHWLADLMKIAVCCTVMQCCGVMGWQIL